VPPVFAISRYYASQHIHTRVKTYYMSDSASAGSLKMMMLPPAFARHAAMMMILPRLPCLAAI